MSAAPLRLFSAEAFAELAGSSYGSPSLGSSPSSRGRFDSGRENKKRAPLTLRQVFEQCMRDDLQKRGRKGKTIAEYDTALDRWDCYWEIRAADITSATHPTADLVTYEDLVNWRDWLLVGIVPSNRAANKCTGPINAILRVAGNRQLATRPPKLEPLPERKSAAKIIFPDDHLSALYEACSVANWPKKLWFPAPVFWRAAIVLYFNFGFRTSELISCDRNLPPLTWGQVSWDSVTPDPNGEAVNEFGWLHYVPEKQKRKKPDPLFMPLHPIVAAHLQSIMPPNGPSPDAKVFPFPLCSREFGDCWRAILAKAGIRPKNDLKGNVRAYNVNHLRKTCETRHNNHASTAGVQNRIGQVITGHAARNVGDANYHNPEQEILRSVMALPQPAAFQAIFEHRQRLLF